MFAAIACGTSGADRLRLRRSEIVYSLGEVVRTFVQPGINVSDFYVYSDGWKAGSLGGTRTEKTGGLG